MGSKYCDGLESWKSVDIEIKIVYEEDLRVFDGFASGSNIEQCQMVEWLPSAHQRDSSHRQLQNHRNKTVVRDRPQSTPRIQLL